MNKPKIALCLVEDCPKAMSRYSSKWCSTHKTRMHRHKQANLMPIEYKEKVCHGCKSTFLDTDKNQRTKACTTCREKPWKLYPSTRNWENSAAGREYMQKYHRTHKAKWKKLVYDHYGWVCSCCQENNSWFLTIDHVNNDGGTDRKNNIRGTKLYQTIVERNYPDDYRILCMNCNFARKHTKGKICPHQM